MSQKSQIEKLLRRGRVLTAAQIRDLGVTKPSARITELRNEGMRIVTTTKKGESAWKLDKAFYARPVQTPAYASPFYSF
jgi:hypothetical protein